MGALSGSRTAEEFNQLKGQAEAYKGIMEWLNVLETPQPETEE